MSWEREEWVKEYQAGATITEIARRHGASRKAVYKWVERYQEYGLEGLRDLSRAPHRQAGAVSELWAVRIRTLRQREPRWGPATLHWKMEQDYAGEAIPSESSIGRILRQSGLSQRRRRVRAQGSVGPLHAGTEANQVWGIDFKGWWRTRDGARCEPLTISDHATRYLLCCQALGSTRGALVRAVMERVFDHYGLPERIRSDNGAPFGTPGECGLTELSVWWIELGIAHERIQPGRPQQNGRHERMHRTLQEAVGQAPAGTARQQQLRLEAFRRQYNEQRPHQALGQQVPAAVYAPSVRPYRGVKQPEYQHGWMVRKVDEGGQMKWEGRKVFLSHALAGKLVGLEPVQERCWRVWFHQHWLGMWDPAQGHWWWPRQWDQKVRG